MYNKTTLLAAIMMLSIGTSSIVYAATACKDPHPFAHHAGTGCTGGFDFCLGCDQDSDLGGCAVSSTSTTACQANPVQNHHHTPLNYVQTGTNSFGLPTYACNPLPQVLVYAEDGVANGPCTATPTKSKTKTALPSPN